MATQYYTLEDVAKNNGKNGSKVWIVIKGSVYDVTDYFNEHPGGGDLILEWAGKDATRAYDDAGHSPDAKRELKQYKIGEIMKADLTEKRERKTDENLVTEKDNKTKSRRSCLSYLTCGRCG